MRKAVKNKLKKCPFCGSKPKLISDFKKKKGRRTAYVKCYGCLSEGYIADSCIGETEKTAIDKWNTEQRIQ
jgi:Lar family restriction alleviation protein